MCRHSIDECMAELVNEMDMKNCSMQRFLDVGVKNTFSCVFMGFFNFCEDLNI